jgi:hypothetical protein
MRSGSVKGNVEELDAGISRMGLGWGGMPATHRRNILRLPTRFYDD